MASQAKLQGDISGENDLFEYTVVDGFAVTKSYVKDRHILDEWEVYNEDIWIAGHPKAGTTWTQEMVWLIANDLDFEGAKKSIQERTPHWEDSTLMDIRPVGIKKNVEIPLFRADSLRFIKENKEKGKTMCIKTHLAFPFLPKQIRDGNKKTKIVYVTRNPKDTCVSMYHYLKNLVGLDIPLEQFATMYVEGKVVYGPIWDHTISYWKERHRPNMLILTFEEMKENLSAVLHKVADFLEKKFTEEQFKMLADHLSFESMRNNPAVNFTNLFDLYKRLGMTSGEGIFLRSGKVGSYKTELSSKLIEKFDKVSLEKTKESGWKFI